MIIEDAVINRVTNDNSDMINDLLSCGKEPSTEDVLAVLELSWFMQLTGGKKVSVVHVFDKTTEYAVEGLEINIGWKHYKTGLRMINVKASEFNINKETISVIELEKYVYQYTVNHIKKTMPKSDIYFKTVALAKAGGKV